METFRAFSREFVNHMELANAWPHYRTICKWLSENAGGMQTQRYTQLTRGAPLEARYCINVVRYLLEQGKTLLETGQAKSNSSYCAMVEFFSERQWPAPLALSIGEVVERICTPATNRRSTSLLDEVSPRAFVERMLDHNFISKYVLACNGPSDVGQAVEWFFVELGRLTAAKPELPCQDAVHVAESVTHSSLEAYQRRAVAWHHFNPWTVVLVRSERQLGFGRAEPTAMSICLPLREQSYESIIRREIMTYECDPTHLHKPSTTLLHEAVAQRPIDCGGDENPTAGIAIVAMAQAGILSHQLRASARKSVRIMSIGATDLAVTRLKRFGYVPLGAQMKTANVDLYQLTLTRFRPLWHLLRMVGDTWRSPPPD